MVDSSEEGNQSVFTVIDLHTRKLTSADQVEMLGLAREKVRAAVNPLRRLIKSVLEAEFGVKNPLQTFPLLLSQIRAGETGREYSRPHVDFYSYQETLIHFTAVLYLHSPALSGGKTTVGGLKRYFDKVAVRHSVNQGAEIDFVMS